MMALKDSWKVRPGQMIKNRVRTDPRLSLSENRSSSTSPSCSLDGGFKLATQTAAATQTRNENKGLAFFFTGKHMWQFPSCNLRRLVVKC